MSNANAIGGTPRRKKSRRNDKPRRLREAGRVLVFSLAPALPILIMLVVSAYVLNEEFAANHLVLISEAATVEQHGELQAALATATNAFRAIRETATISGPTRSPPESSTNVAAPVGGAPEVQPNEPGAQPQSDEDEASGGPTIVHLKRDIVSSAWNSVSALEAASEPVRDNTSPIALARKENVRTLRQHARALRAAIELTKPIIEGCRCEAPTDHGTKEEALDSLQRALTEADALVTFYRSWADAEARQAPEAMKALNATVILIVGSAAAVLWCISLLLPHGWWGGTQFGGLGKLRIGAIVVAVVLFVRLAFVPRDLPLMPYGIVTDWVFQRTLHPALHPSGDTFYNLNFIGIGLVTAALLLAFTATAVAAWTFDKDNPPIKALNVYDRMRSVRGVLYVAAGVSAAAMITVEAEFSAAASLFVEATSDAPSPARALVESVGGVIVLAHGIALGAALAAAYVPAAMHLYPAYHAWKAEHPSAADGSSFLTGETMGMILRFLAIIAPVIAGTVGGILGQSVGTAN